MGIFSRLEAWYRWLAADPLGFLIYLVFFALSVLLTLVLHEIGHGYVAWRCGDPTAKMLGRLSLDPRKHLDPVGTLCLIFLGFGWAKPVPVNPNYFKKPKEGMAVTALAGPASNFLLALLLLLIARLVYARALVTGALPETLFSFLVNTACLSVGLGLFNLVPVPPLDGSKVVAVLLPDRAYNWLMRYEQLGMVLLVVIISVGVGSNALNAAIDWVFGLFCRIVGF